MEYAANAGGQLMLIGGEVQAGRVLGVSRFPAAVGEHAVDAEVAGVVRHVVDAAVAEMREDVGEVQPRHRDFADAHLKEGAERCENSLPSLGCAKAGGRGKIASLHDAAAYEDFRMLFAYVVQSAGSFQIVIEDPHRRHSLGFFDAIE